MLLLNQLVGYQLQWVSAAGVLVYNAVKLGYTGTL